MKFDVNAVRARGVSIYNDFTVGQRAMVIFSTLLLVFGGMTFMKWASAPSWAPLYTNLESADAADITAELDSAGVAYELQDGGSTIMVDRTQVYATRLDLSTKGLPKVGRDGWNLIDEQGITTSEFRQRIDLQRAMEGELARSIASIEAVENATVHLVMPEDDLFSGDDVHPSASVQVETANGSALSAGQVQAVVHLVAASVEGLTPDFVTLTDTAGRVLSAAGTSGVDLAAGEQQLTQKSTYENAVAASIQTLLEPVVGAGRARVVVSADLNFDEKRSTSETFGDPGTAPVVSEDTSKETYVNSDGQLVGGVLGPDVVPTTVGAGQGSNYDKENAARTYAVDKVTEQVKAAPGGVERLSVAVLVDEAAGIDTIEVGDLVTAAAGLVPARGDTIEVRAMAFGEDATAAPEGGTSADAGQGDLVGNLIRTGGVLALVAVVLLLAYRSARRSSLARYPVAIPLPSAVEETQALLAELGNEIDRAAPLAIEPAEPAEPARHLVLHNQIGELIDRQPEDVASVLRAWLADRRG